jgi:thiol-disulfide isomerase/thioredoxin
MGRKVVLYSGLILLGCYGVWRIVQPSHGVLPGYRIGTPSWVPGEELVRLDLETPGGPLPVFVRWRIFPVEKNSVGMISYPHMREEREKFDFIATFTVEYPQMLDPGLSVVAFARADLRLDEVGPEMIRLTLNMDPYDSALVSKFDETEITKLSTMIPSGHWVVRRGDAIVYVPFRAVPADHRTPLFDALNRDVPAAKFGGRWRVRFSGSDQAAVGVFEVGAYTGNAAGTFLTPTGDYRHLAGRVDGDLMRLSTFDGAHAYLFHARMQPDGTISGDFWSGNWHHETWTAVRDDDARLPDPFAQTAPTAALVDDLVFRALDGTPTRVADLLDAGGGKARIIEVFGSWCPNCADAGAEMRRLKDKYGDRLTIVGLAFERSAEHAEAAERVRAYADRFGADWPLLIGGLADKSKASAELPILDQVRAFPTTIFLNERNEVVRVHSGFVGPAGRGDHLEQQRAFETIIDELLAE